MIRFNADAVFASITPKSGEFLLQNTKIWVIHWFNHLHFCDPQHIFRKKLWTNTYLNFVFYLPTDKRCWCGEFVKKKKKKLKSAVVVGLPYYHWRIFLIGDDDFLVDCPDWHVWSFLNWCLAFTHRMRWCVFWYIRNSVIWLLRINAEEDVVGFA